MRVENEISISPVTKGADGHCGHFIQIASSLFTKVAYVETMSERPSSRHPFIDRSLGATSQQGAGGAILNLPPLIVWLLGLMVLVFVVQGILPQRPTAIIDGLLGFRPVRFHAGLFSDLPLGQTLFPLMGHVFVHANIPHLAFNSLWLAIFGAGVARRMALDSGKHGYWNSFLFMTFFFLSGAAGAILFYVGQPLSPSLLVGASGAISGLMGAAMRFVLRPITPMGSMAEHRALAPLGSAPVLGVSAVYIGINLMTALGLDGAAGMNVAWEAHIGGYVFGLLAFPFFDSVARPG